MSRLPSCLVVLLAGTIACASGAGRTPAAGSPAAEQASTPPTDDRPRPLADLASARVVVTPVQALRAGDPLGFAVAAGDPRRYLALVDDEIAWVLGERGLRPAWAMGPDAARIARRNPTLAVDAYALGAGELRTDPAPGGPELTPPLSSRLRALAALHDARYVIVPVELRFEGAPGAGRAVLRVAVVDTRAAQLAWSGDVASATSPAFSPALAASVAGHLADLITAAR